MSWKTIFPQGWGGMVSRWFKYITFKLTSSCVAQFLTCQDWYWFEAWRSGTPEPEDKRQAFHYLPALAHLKIQKQLRARWELSNKVSVSFL